MHNFICKSYAHFHMCMHIFIFTFAINHVGFCLYFCLIFLSMTLFGICAFAVNHKWFYLYFCRRLLLSTTLFVCYMFATLHSPVKSVEVFVVYLSGCVSSFVHLSASSGMEIRSFSIVC